MDNPTRLTEIGYPHKEIPVSMTPAAKAGWDAAGDGLTRDSNPYPKGTDNHRHWDYWFIKGTHAITAKNAGDSNWKLQRG